MTSKQLLISAAVLSLIITVGAISYTQAAEPLREQHPQISQSDRGAHRGWFAQKFKNRKQMHQTFSAVRHAIEADDYQAWADLMQNRPHDPAWINEQTFNKLKEMHALKLEGDIEGAKKIAEELGIQKFHNRHKALRMFRGVRQAIEKKDYDAWAELMNNHPKYEGAVNEATFNQHLRLHELMRNGAYTEAKALAEELGIKPGKRHQGMWR
ncbi:hypothetical protein GF380_04425 [Candidatus Uhrbacteria bacterium]|nr:hypothetical protein [Candidatus Uhrbacteria bacterium]MBD3284306.1 hypothetical protein [Candidatus Uhrbacteria bacterium]